MRFYKIIRRDIQINPGSILTRVSIALLFFAFLFISFIFEVFHYFPMELGSPKNINQLGLSLGDLILVEAGGTIPKLDAMQKRVILFPVSFFLIHIIPCCFTLNYLHDDINQGGIQVFTRLGNMNLWWYSKCIHNFITVVSYYVLGFAVWALLCLLTGKTESLIPNSRVFEAFFSAYFTNASLPAYEFILCMFILPILVVSALSLCEMTLTLFMKPIYSFFVICIYFISGIYILHPAFLTNYAMSVRNAAIGVYNFNSLFGICLCLAISAASVIIGKLRLRRFDIIGER